MTTQSTAVRTQTRSTSSVLAAVALACAACSGSGSGDGGASGSGRIGLTATDTPFAFDIVQEASISVDRITAAHAADAESGFLTLYDGAPIVIALSSLRNGITQTLADSTIPSGSYRQFRLHVTDARLVLTNGNVYTTADGTIHLTSQQTSGFKIFVDPPIEVVSGQTSNVLLDFDLTQTFHPIPANDPLTATSYSLHPVIHAVNLVGMGGIEGTVSQDDGSGGTMPAANATVYVLLPGQDDPATSVTATATNPDGAYAVLGLEPGTYDVMAVKDTLSATVAGVTVTAGSATQVDLLLGVPVGGDPVVITRSLDGGKAPILPQPAPH
jgi:hypothetical protein